jgi:hypothetical protein
MHPDGCTEGTVGTVKDWQNNPEKGTLKSISPDHNRLFLVDYTVLCETPVLYTQEHRQQESAMKLDKHRIISADVLLRSASGLAIGSETRINTENLDRFVPPPDAYPVVADIFLSLGFDVGPMTGMSFSITAAVGTFEAVFKIPLRSNPSGGIETDGGKLELDPSPLPAKAVHLIQVVAFSEPPDFGPSDY